VVALTLLVQLVHLELGAGALQGLLAGAAVRAVALGEHHNGVLVDERLGLGLCRFHGDRR